MSTTDRGSAELRARLGANLKAMRKLRGFTQAELALMLGLSRTSITNIELGRQGLLVEVLAKWTVACELHGQLRVGGSELTAHCWSINLTRPWSR